MEGEFRGIVPQRASKARPGVLLDRDGVINAMLWINGELDSPLAVEHVALLPRVGEAIRRLNQRAIPVAIVSNQPVIAKGKTSPETLRAITHRILDLLGRDGAAVDGVYYCLHHPLTKVDALRAVCECRKPAPGLLRRACADLNLDPGRSFMVGDRETDVMAGRSAGTRTVLIADAPSAGETATCAADRVAPDLFAAVEWILQELSGGGDRGQSAERF